MSNVAMLSVVLRLVALWLFVSVLDVIAWPHAQIFQQPSLAVWTALKFVLAVWFFFWPLSALRGLVPKEARKPNEVETWAEWTPDILQTVLFSAAGVWILATTITSHGFAGGILFLVTGDSRDLYFTGASFILAVIKLVIGLWLLFGARGLLHLVGVTRRARLDNKLFEDGK